MRVGFTRDSITERVSIVNALVTPALNMHRSL